MSAGIPTASAQCVGVSAGIAIAPEHPFFHQLTQEVIMAIISRRSENDPLVTAPEGFDQAPIKPLPTPTDPLCLKRKCKRCSGEYLPSGQNQKYCPDCKENDMKVRKAVKKIQTLTPMTPRETTAIGPVVDAAMELVRRCTELGISHAVQLNISGTKLTIERG